LSPCPKWNGNFQAVGGGGLNGTIPGIGPAVAAGYAAAATDTGHVGSNLQGHFVRNTVDVEITKRSMTVRRAP
jgi:hypothetical protein